LSDDTSIRAPSRLPGEPELSDVFRAYPVGVRELLVYHDLVLRHPSPLSVAERELIAAVVSGTNACGYCLGAHTIIATTFGVDENLIRAVVDDVDAAPLDERLRELLRFVIKLTRAPASVRTTDRQAVLAAGWSEEALYYAVVTCALFNFMNRVVEGMGVRTSPGIQARQRERHARTGSSAINNETYQDYGRAIGLLPGG
jgi:uncharacterized peroxidase-related enzyme